MSLRRTLDETLGDQLAVPVSPRVVKGHPAEVLTEAAKDADLLVMGSREHGEFTGMLLGSVSQHCVQHVQGPVLVVRTAED
ncbi:universal stress protein [Amycolatopsis nivea]